MRVLLLYVSMPENVSVPESGKQRRVLFPSLTLAHLAALFPRDYDVVLCNEDIEDLPTDEDYDLVGITFYGVAAARAFRIAQRFRSRGIPVVFGGPAATTAPEMCRPYCDCLVVGEAETALPQLIADLEAGHLAREYASDRLADIASLPIPRYDLMDRNHYMGVFPVQTPRGCTFKCSFCSVAQLNRNTVRYRPIDEVLRDIQAAVTASGSRHIFFVDDNINMNPKRAKDLFEALIPLRIEWHSFATSLIGKQPDVLRLAAKSGCRMLFMGFESLSQGDLRDLNKSFNRPDEYREIIAAIHDAGIHIMPSFIFGMDGEDAGVFRRTLDFIEANRLSFPLFHILTPVPDTPLYDRLRIEGRILVEDIEQYDGSHIVFRPDGMEPAELQRGFDWIVRTAYSLPSILRRTILCRPLRGRHGLRMQMLAAGINLHYWRKARPGASRP